MIKQTVVLLLVLVMPFAGGYGLSHKRQNAILKKAISMYRGLSSSKIKWKTLGTSNRKNRIYYREFGSGGKLTMIVGGIHGDEPVSFISAVMLAGTLQKNPLLINNRVIIIPCLNPDGLLKGIRTNGRGVDINRNFPTATWSFSYAKAHNNPGKFPASEPETVLLANFIEDTRPELLIQMHQPFNSLFPDHRVPSDLLKVMSAISGLPVKDDIGYETPGSLGSLKSTFAFKIYGITYELCAIDAEPDYNIITLSLIEAINHSIRTGYENR
jgi:protein MpaA